MQVVEKPLKITIEEMNQQSGQIMSDRVNFIVSFNVKLIANKELLEKYHKHPEISLDVLNEFIETRE